ncbi:MAG: universal stress protein [Actinomycetota bacterium]|nr:universal stress protein [Actinomycetota bacterium]
MDTLPEILPTRILLAADGSRDSRLALRMAAGLSGRLGAELHVVYVALISPWVLGGRVSDVEYRQLRQEQQGFLDGLVQQVEAAGGTVAEAHFMVGHRADEKIIQLSEELGADLVIVGSKGQRTIERALMGSDSESVVRYARCPVMVVREGSLSRG